jgi:prepilin-type N-terminal cleavage/methylation domain-containing protein
MRTHQSKGFTLIELLTVIAIIGILTAMTAVGLGRVLEKAKLAKTKGTCDGIHSSLVSFYADNDTFPPAFEMLLPKMDIPLKNPPDVTYSSRPFYELLELAKPEVVDNFSRADASFVYVPVNTNQFKKWKRYWDDLDGNPATPESSLYADELPSVVPPPGSMPTVTQPARYDAYVLIGVGPLENYFGLTDVQNNSNYINVVNDVAAEFADPDPDVVKGKVANFLALRTYYLATKGIEDESMGWKPLLHFDTRRTGDSTGPLPVNPADSPIASPGTATPGTFGYGPYIYIPAGL